jgi:thiamine kinase-like enzyme
LTRINVPVARDERAAAAVIGQIPALRRDGPQGGQWSIAPMPSFTNRTYRIERGGEAYILRLPGQGTERYIDRTGEAANARAAVSIGIAPEIVFADPASGVMVTRFIRGAEPLSPSRLRSRAELEATVSLLHKLHASTLAFQGEMRLYPKMDEYLGLAAAPSLQQLRRAIEPLRGILEPGWGPPRPCHIDPAPHNFIAAGSAHYLIDWEYSAMCEPLWDLAGLSIEGEFDTSQDEAMLACYFGTAEPRWLSRLHLYRLVLRLLAASWCAVKLADDSSPALADMLSRLEAGVAADLAAGNIDRHIAAA